MNTSTTQSGLQTSIPGWKLPFLLLLSMLLISCMEKQEVPENPRLAYVLANIGNREEAIFSYNMDPVSGIPSLIGNATGIRFSHVTSIATSNSGKFLYMRTEDDLVYPLSIKKDTSFLQSIVPPTHTSVPQNKDYHFISMVIDPMNQYLFISRYRTTIKTVNKIISREYPESVIEIYSLDSKTGSPTFKSLIGPLYGELTQLEFSKFGKYIYASSQTYMAGVEIPHPTLTLFTLKMDRVNGTLTTIDKITGSGWMDNSGRALVLDPTGKFLFLIASSSLCDNARKIPPRPYNYSWHSKGSVVRSYLIDQSSGRLTFSGSSVNISPELFTWGAMHPDGSFLYFLSTHDSADVEECADPITRHPTGIYSYYINRETGEMLYTGIDYGGASGRSSIQVDNSGGFLYHQTPRFVNVHNIDPATGELEPIGSPLHGATEYDFPGTAYSFPLNLISY